MRSELLQWADFQLKLSREFCSSIRQSTRFRISFGFFTRKIFRPQDLQCQNFYAVRKKLNHKQEPPHPKQSSNWNTMRLMRK